MRSPPTVPASSDEGFGPRKVRTVVVRPDGTIVSSQASAPGDAAAAQPSVAAATGPASPAPAPAAVEPLPPATTTPPVDPNNDTLAIAGANGGVDANGELKITPMAGATGAMDGGDQAAADGPTATPAPAAPAANRPSTVVATREPSQAIEITPAPRAAAAPSPSPAPAQTAALAASGMLVQVSSQRSEDAARATFRDLQARYPSILGSYQVNIQRADLGDRGVFYRARVGPFSSSDAQRLCDDLKAAGGDCILAHR